jgi:hypothetical protein
MHPNIEVHTPEVQAPPEPKGLSELGRRTLSGYRLKWGPIDGTEKFSNALEKGLIDKTKMTGQGAPRAPKAKAPKKKAK